MSSGDSKPSAYLCRRLTHDVELALQARYNLHINEHDSILGPNEIAHLAKGSQILFVTATESVTEDLIEQLSPCLRYVATLSVGYDHIDMAAANRFGIQVLHTPDVLSEACAEIAMMLILTACRRGYEADQLVRSGQWQGWSPTQLLGVGLTGRRLLIFGMGRIGREIAKRARAFGMQIHYHNRRRLDPDQEMGALFHENLDDALCNADIVVVAAPGSPALKGIINAESIARMPDGSVLINISRGDLVDDDALINALNSGKLFSAGLDVFSNEPHVDARYFALKNVFLTPHIGSATRETRDAMGWMLVNGLEQLRQGQQPSNLITIN